MKGFMVHIPKDKCKDRKLYRINSRNLTLGVYRSETGGFIGLRTKFDCVYTFEEYHWDNGPPYGTVKPILGYADSPPPDIVVDDDPKNVKFRAWLDSMILKYPE